MNVGNINGPGGVERGRGRSADADPRDATPRAGDAPTKDTASISQDGRASLEAVEQLTERARKGEDRTALLDAVRAMMTSGKLATPEAFRGAAEAMLRGE